MKAVKIYGKALAQCINSDKSSLLFSKSVCGDVKKEIKFTLGIENEDKMRSYLEISKNISGSKYKLFAFLKDITRTYD